jgi:hypothetical protein
MCHAGNLQPDLRRIASLDRDVRMKEMACMLLLISTNFRFKQEAQGRVISLMINSGRIRNFRFEKGPSH